MGYGQWNFYFIFSQYRKHNRKDYDRKQITEKLKIIINIIQVWNTAWIIETQQGWYQEN